MIKRYVVLLFFTGFMPLVAHPFLSDVAPVAKVIDGVTVSWFLADVAAKATKTLNLSAQEVLFLKVQALKSAPQRNLFGSKNAFADELLALLRAKKACAVFVKMPQVDDSFVLQVIFDEKGTASFAVYAKSKKIQSWVLPTISACFSRSRIPVSQASPWVTAGGAVLGLGLAGFVTQKLNGASPQARTAPHVVPVGGAGRKRSPAANQPSPLSGSGRQATRSAVSVTQVPSVLPNDVPPSTPSTRVPKPAAPSADRAGNASKTPFQAARPPTPPATPRYGPDSLPFDRAGAGLGNSARPSFPSAQSFNLDSFFQARNRVLAFQVPPPRVRTFLDAPLSYKKDRRMDGFAQLLLSKLANIMHLRERQVCFKSTLKDGRDSTFPSIWPSDSSWGIDATADLVVVEAHSRDAFDRLRKETTIFSAPSQASLKVIVIPFSAFDNPAYAFYSKALQINNWVIAVVDDGSKKYPVRIAGQEVDVALVKNDFKNLLSGFCPYVLLVSPEESGDFNVWFDVGTSMCTFMRNAKWRPQLEHVQAVAEALMLRRRNISPTSFLAADFSEGFNASSSQDECLVLQRSEDVDRLLVYGTEHVHERMLAVPEDVGARVLDGLSSFSKAPREAATSHFHADLPNPLNSYGTVVASCMQMKSWEEIQDFIFHITSDEFLSWANADAPDEALEAQTMLFTPRTTMTGSRRRVRAEVEHAAMDMSPHFDEGGLSVEGFAESDVEYHTPSRKSRSVEHPFDQNRVLLVPWSLVHGNKSAFLALRNNLERCMWRTVFINDMQRPLGRDEILSNEFKLPCDSYVFVTSVIGSQTKIFILEPYGVGRFMPAFITYGSLSWMDVVRKWIHDPESIADDPSAESTLSLKRDDGSLAFEPFETQGRRNPAAAGLIPFKVSALSFTELDFVSFPEAKNPFAAPGVSFDVKFFKGFVDAFVSTLRQQGGSFWVLAEEDKDKIDEIIRKMAKEENIVCPPDQARYLIVPARLIDHEWIDRATIAVDHESNLSIFGVLNVGNWRLIVVDDTNFPGATLITKALNPLIAGFLTKVLNCSFVAPNGGQFFGVHIDRVLGSDPDSVENDSYPSVNSLSIKIMEIQKKQTRFSWDEVKMSLHPEYAALAVADPGIGAGASS